MASELFFETYYLQCIAQASYIVGHNGWAFLIDPRRDVDMYLHDLSRHGLRLKGVLLSHLHADFVSGNEELRKKLGVTVFVGARAEAQYPHYPVVDGDTLALSDRYAFRAMTTPGHTPGCVTWILVDRANGDRPMKVRLPLSRCAPLPCLITSTWAGVHGGHPVHRRHRPPGPRRQHRLHCRGHGARDVELPAPQVAPAAG